MCEVGFAPQEKSSVRARVFLEKNVRNRMRILTGARHSFFRKARCKSAKLTSSKKNERFSKSVAHIWDVRCTLLGFGRKTRAKCAQPTSRMRAAP